MKLRSNLVCAASLLMGLALATNASATTNTADSSGSIDDPTIWTGDVGPVAGDTNTWDISGFTILATNDYTFLGQTLRIGAGGVLRKAPKATVSLTVGNMVLDGGSINQDVNNQIFTVELQGNNLELNNGSFIQVGGNGNRSIFINNAVVVGSGTILLNSTLNGTFDKNQVLFSESDMSGFTGTFVLTNNARINLPTIVDGTFGLELSGTSQFVNDQLATFSSLVMGADVIPEGTYTYGDFTIAQQAFLTDGGAAIVVGIGGVVVGDYQADQDGSIDDPIIWGGDVGPVSGDTNTWDLNIYSISAPSNATFEGETLYIPEGASLVKSTGGNNAAVLNLNNLELDGGTIKSDQENGLFTLDLQGNTLQLNSGEFYTGANGVAPRTFNIQNAVLAGSGTITVDSARTGTPANRWVNFNASVSNANTMAGFTGTFSLVNNGVIAFPELIDPYFGVEIATTNAQLILTNLVAFSSLVLGGEPVASGQYFYADLTTNQQPYFVDGGGGVAVGQSIFVPPNAADILISYDMGMILVGSTNLSDHPAVTNWLQMKTDLVNGDEWSDVDMSTGVTETNWNVVVTNGAFFQIESRY